MWISKLIKKLRDSIDCVYGVNVISKTRIDNEYPDGVMKYFLQKSLVKLKSYADRNNNTIPTKEQWNKYAKENNCLSSDSIKYMVGINFPEK